MSRNTRRSRRRSTASQRIRQQSWLRRYLRTLSTGVAAASIGAAGVFGQQALGATDTWTGNTSVNWADAANWSTLPATGDSLAFGAAGSAGTVLNDNLTFPTSFTFGTITFNVGAPTYSINAASGTRGFTISTGGITNLSSNVENFNDNIVVIGTATEMLTAGGGNLSLGGVILGPGGLATAGSGVLTITGNNTFSGGINVAANTTLDIGRGTSVGTGALTFSGASTVDNVSGSSMTLTNNNAVNINADLTFLGSQNLNMGTGAVTLGGAAGTRNLTIDNGATLTTGPIFSATGSGIGLNVASGTLTISPVNNGNTVAVQTSVDGTLNVVAGARLNIGQDDVFFGGLTGAGTIANGSNTTRWLTVGSNNASSTFNGTLIDGNSVARMGLRKRGTGTLTLTGANTLSDQITVDNGTLVIAPTASIIPAFGNGNNLVVGSGGTDGTQKGIMKIQGGTVEVQTVALGQGFGVNGNNTDNHSGALYQTGGTLQILNVANTNNFRIGDGGSSLVNNINGDGGYGYYNLSGATSQVNLAEFAVGGGNGTGNATNINPGNMGVMDMTGGTINDVGWITVARGTSSTGIMNVSGGTINYTNAGGGQFYLGGQGGAGWYGVVNVSNATIQNPIGSNVPLNIANTTGGTAGIVNLGPGAVFRAGNVGATAVGAQAYLNFTGGTLQASVSNANFINGANANAFNNSGANLTDIVVYQGGGTIDNNGSNITIARSLSAPQGNGITSISVDNGGSGYIGAPAIVIANAPGAAAIANMVDDGSGNGTFKIGSITITSPGTNVSAPTLTLLGGGSTVPATIGGTIGTAPNVSGGMTFKGSGVTTLSGASTFSGPTNIIGGTVFLASGGSLENTSQININGTGAKLRANSTITAPTVMVTNGTLDGAGTVGTVVVPNGSGTVTNGNGTAASLTVGSLTYNGTGTWSPVVSDGTSTSPALSVTTLAFNGAANSVTVSPTNSAGAFTNTTYTLAHYSSLTGFSALKANVVGLGGRQTQVLTNDTANSNILLTIGGDFLKWTGSGSSNWQLIGLNDWALSSSAAATAYQATSGVEDAVVFDDSATGSKTVSISSGNVSPPRVTFNNTSGGGAYTINGASGIAGTGSLFINGTGAVTINTPNTFTGGVTVSNGSTSGTLNIGNDSALGSGPLTLGLNSTIDAVGGAHTLSSSNVQNWNGDFTFTGSNNLNLGIGAVQINYNSGNAADVTPTNSAGTTSSVTVSGGSLTVGGPLTGPSVALDKKGVGKLILNGPAMYTGTTIIHSGELQTSGGLGTINQDIQLSPASTDDGTATFTVNGGTVNVERVIISGNSGNALAGGTTWKNATMNLSSGTVICGQWFTVGSGGGTPTAGATGTFNMSGGTLDINTGVSGAQFEIGNFTGMSGVVNQTNGDINLYNGGRVAMLANGGSLSGIYNMSGGTLNTFTNGGITHGGGAINLGVTGTGTGTFNFTGGTAWVQGITAAAATTTTFNFDGGTLKAAQNNASFINTIDNFNISQNAANPITIDDNGVVITIPQNILHGAFQATDAGINKQGAGTMSLSGSNSFNGGIRLNAGTLGINSATALGANNSTLTINAAGTSIDNTSAAAVTLANNNPENWNFDFTYAGTQSLNTGAGPIALNATRTVTTNAATAGTTLTIGGVISGNGFGLIKAGSGNMALAGTNAYTGATSVNGGNLLLSGSGSVNTSSGITINGGKLTQNSSATVTPTVTLTTGTLDGTTTINTVNVANNLSAIVTDGSGSTSATTITPLTIGSLNFNGAASINLVTSDPTRAIAKIQTTSLATSAAGNVVINGTNNSGGVWSAGNYAVLSYASSIGGAGFNKFVVGQLTGLGAHQTANLTNNAGVISLVIAGDTLVWTGGLDGSWSVNPQSAPHNWKLSSSGAQADFFTNDAVSFPDGATTGNVNLASNIAAAAIQFTNTSSGLPYTIASTGGFSITSGSVSITNGGSVTIANANSYAGGTTLVNGTLNIGNATAIGTGTLTIAGGTLNNTSGSVLTLSNNNAQNWNGDFTFADSSDLIMGTGPVTLGGTGTTRTVTISSGDLSVGPISGSQNLSLVGPGTLTIDSSSGNNGAQSNLTGELNIDAGAKLQIGSPNSSTPSDFNAGGLNGAGIVENGSTGIPTGTNILERWLILNNSANDVFSGTLQDGAGGANSRLGLSKSGAGNLTLSGNNSLSGTITVAGGQLILTGSINPANDTGTANGPVNVGTVVNGQNGILNIQGGSMTIPKNTAPSIAIGNAAGTVGRLDVSNNGTLTTTSELWLSQADGSYGVMNVSSGTVNVGSWMALGRGGGVGMLNMSGGSLTVATNALTIGSLGGATGDGIVHGQANITGGTVTVNFSTTGGVFVGEQVNGVMNVSGTGQVTSFPAEGVTIGRNAGAFGNLNLASGGTVTTATLHTGQLLTGANTGGTGNLNFHGGTLQANASDGSNGFNFIPANGVGYAGTLNVYSYKEGANIDDGGFSITIDAPILAPTGNGVSAAGLTVGGGGFIGTPAVQITGGGGTGATANAVINGSGNLTGIVITNPGTGYTSAPAFVLVGGGNGNTGVISGSATLVPNVSGGLTKLGSGTLTLTGTSTYTGPTKVTSGTLQLAASGVINSASSLNMAGGTLNTEGFNQSFSTLKLTGNATIDMSSPQASSEVLNFVNSRNAHWVGSQVLTLNNWTNATSDQILFPTANSLNANQLNEIQFAGSGDNFAKLVPVGSSFELEPSPTAATGVMKYGDVNQDGVVNVADVSALMAALTNLNAYQAGTATYPGTGNLIRPTTAWDNSQLIYVADTNYNDAVDNGDIQSLISYIANGGTGGLTAVPEPTSFVLMILGAVPGVWLAGRSIRRRKNADQEATDDSENQA